MATQFLRSVLSIRPIPFIYSIYLTLFLTAGGQKEPFYFQRKYVSPGFLKQNNLLRIKNAKYLSKLFVSKVFPQKVIFNVLLMIMQVQFTFLLSKSSG
jgi:hypothetical protein